MPSESYERWYKPRAQWLKDHHMCIDCKQQDAYTLIGKCRCADCTEKNRIRDTKSHNPIPRSLWAEMGLCPSCGLVEVDSGQRICNKCYEHMKRMSAISHRNDKPGKPKDPRPNPNMPRSDWVKNGFCYLCGEKRLPDSHTCWSCRNRLRTQRKIQKERGQDALFRDMSWIFPEHIARKRLRNENK